MREFKKEWAQRLCDEMTERVIRQLLNLPENEELLPDWCLMRQIVNCLKEAGLVKDNYQSMYDELEGLSNK